MPETMKDYFMVQFGQRLEKTAGIPDLNVPTVLVVLEGTLTVGGFLVQELQVEGMNARMSAMLSQRQGGW